MTDVLDHYIGGSWEPGSAADETPDLNPSDLRDVLTTFRLMDRDQTTRALGAAVEAAAGWKATSPLERAAIFGRAADGLRGDRDAIARAVSTENGKTIGEATIEVEKSADFLDFYAGTARAPQGSLLADGRPGTRTFVIREPVGVVLAITPWNDPMLTPARKIAPALIAGNAVLLKPARDTPLAAYHLVKALVEAGLPPGVLGTAMTDHATIAEAMVGGAVNAVTFTGSTDVGLGLHRGLAGHNVRLQTEMGGKNAAVVLADADLELAAATIIAAGFGQAGQRCTATSRVIVEAPVYDEVVERLAAGVAAIRLGASTDPTTTMGPVVSSGQRSDVLGHIERAAQQGASIVAGGQSPSGEPLVHGCFVEPTVIAGVTPDMAIWRDEVFGPVVSVSPVASFDDAIAAVNDTVYGLSSSVFTTSLRSAHRFVDASDNGQVSVNLPTSGWDVHHPFGGFKDSGSPFKEQGYQGLEFYTRVKTAAIRFDI